MMRWSRLQRELYKIIDPNLPFQIHCRVVRMKSQRGSTNLPRYWITLYKETIWSYPASSSSQIHFDATKQQIQKNYPYQNRISEISNIIREYIDTPKEELLTRAYDEEDKELISILRAADRRIGYRRQASLQNDLTQTAALKILKVRLDLDSKTK